MRELEARAALLSETVPGFSYGGCRFSLLACRAERAPPGTIINPHRHNHLEIILILDGEARDTIAPGRTLGPGSLQVHGPGALHGWAANGQPVLRLGFGFTLQPEVDVRLPDAWPHEPLLGPMARTLLEETLSVAPGRRERLHARLVLLLAPALALLELPERTPPARSVTARGRDITGAVERFLADNLSAPLALSDVAAQLNISVPTLTRRFRQEAGASVMDRLLDLRMQRAAELLQEGALSIKQVGVAVGIPEPSYFCRCFRQAHGCSPGCFVHPRPVP